MHKMSKESATTLLSLQKRLDRANNIISIYENYLDKLLKKGEEPGD